MEKEVINKGRENARINLWCWIRIYGVQKKKKKLMVFIYVHVRMSRPIKNFYKSLLDPKLTIIARKQDLKISGAITVLQLLLCI